MTDPRHRRKAWVSALPFALWAVIACTVAFSRGIPPGFVPGLVLGLTSLVALIATLDLINWSHARVLRGRYPGAVVVRIVAYPELVDQTSGLLSRDSSPGFRAGRYLSLVVTEHSLMIHGGLFAPVQKFETGLEELRAVTASREDQGKFRLAVVRFQFESAGVAAFVDICPIQTRFGIPLAAKPAYVAQLASTLQAYVPD